MTKKDLKKFKDFSHTDKGKSAIFFGFYFVFFLVLILLISSNKSNNIYNQLEEIENSDNNVTGPLYKVDKIFNDNYRFNYTINIDGVNHIYNGSKYKDMELFTYNNINYYRDKDNFYYNNIIEDKWISINNPYIFTNFIDFKRLGEVIVDASYISKEEFSDGDKIYKYKVSSNSIINRIEEVFLDIEEKPNDILFTADENNDLYKVSLDLTSYGKYKGFCTSNFNIILSYSDFNKIEEINKINK